MQNNNYTPSVPLGTEEEKSDYTFFDDEMHQRLNRWDNGVNVCAPLATLAIFLFFVLAWIPMASISIVLFFFIVGCCFCCFRGHPKLRLLGLIHQAKSQVLKDELPKENDLLQGDNAVRDWTCASGLYQSEPPLNYGGTSGGDLDKVVSIELTFIKFRGHEEKQSSVWSITGRSDRFVILHGLLAASGKAYWVEKHVDQRMVLVQGVLDYNTFTLSATWQDNLGCDGRHLTLQRQNAELVYSATEEDGWVEPTILLAPTSDPEASSSTSTVQEGSAVA
jgi:hypothetical protein